MGGKGFIIQYSLWILDARHQVHGASDAGGLGLYSALAIGTRFRATAKTLFSIPILHNPQRRQHVFALPENSFVRSNGIMR